MKIKTQDLTGAALDWAVAKAVQLPIYQCGKDWPGNHVVNEESLRRPIVTVGLTGRMLLEGPKASENKEWSPSTNWAQGGPIIEREGITLRCGLHGWDAELEEFDAISHGPTALIAAMRCYCCSRLGDVVDVPEELCQQQNS